MEQEFLNNTTILANNYKASTCNTERNGTIKAVLAKECQLIRVQKFGLLIYSSSVLLEKKNIFTQ
jgi:hypothetical protein